MTVALLVITDGRDDYLGRAIASIGAMVDGPITERWMVDDTGDDVYRNRLAGWFPQFVHVGDGPRRGFAGAIQRSWAVLLEHSDAEWVLHWEQDFIATRRVPLDDMIALSEAQPHLAQVALRRQAWGHEVEYGGFMEAAPSWYSERSDGSHTWVETRRNFTTNVSVYRRSLCTVGWPDAPHSEGKFGFVLKDDRGLPWGIPPEQVAFGFLGSMESGREWIHHIGDVRVGTGY